MRHTRPADIDAPTPRGYSIDDSVRRAREGRVVRSDWQWVLTGLSLAFTSACGASLANQGRVELTVGHATHHDILTEVPDALRRYGYAIYRSQETATTLYIETGWQERVPFDDEAGEGVDYARTRFIARARKSGPATYTLRITSENQVRGLPDGSGESVGLPPEGWARMAATEMYTAYVHEITEDIKLKVDAGLRTYGRIRSGS